MFITHRPTLTLQLHNFDLFRTCRTNSFCTVAWQLARFQLTRRIARSLGDSGASCNKPVAELLQGYLMWHWGARLGMHIILNVTSFHLKPSINSILVLYGSLSFQPDWWLLVCIRIQNTPRELCKCYFRDLTGRRYCLQCFDTVGWAAGRATERWGAGMVVCLERGADLHMAQLTPLPLTVSCSSKIQIGFTFLVLAHPGSPEKRAVKRGCVCVTGRCLWPCRSQRSWLHVAVRDTSVDSCAPRYHYN